jgi:molybdopterin converting factor small subunit
MAFSKIVERLTKSNLIELAELAISKGDTQVATKIKELTGKDVSKELSDKDIEVISNLEAKIIDELTKDEVKDKNILIKDNEVKKIDEIVEKVTKEVTTNVKEEDEPVAEYFGRQKYYVESEDPFIARFVPIFTLIFTTLSLLLMAAIVFIEVPESNHTAALSVLEMLKVTVISVVSFFFGKKVSNNNNLIKTDKPIKMKGE